MTAIPGRHAKAGGPVFDVDKTGLAKLLERRGKEFAVLELWQNAADEDGVTTVTMELNKLPGVDGREGLYRLRVEDDSPEGFADMKHAYTLFAESNKKGRADQRGRFNLGEKLVIAICERVTIRTTKGTVEFDAMSRQEYDGADDCSTSGSVFTGELKMTDDEAKRAIAAVHSLIIPEHLTTTMNGVEVTKREPLKTFTQSLRTELADEEGYLRPTRRKTEVKVYEVREGEEASIYEMGIPVVATGDTWHIDIHQKVPLTTDRDNVPPGYLKDVRAAVLNNCSALLDSDTATAKWVDHALEHKDVQPDAVKAVVKDRYGDKVVIDDKSDPEGTKIAVSKGYAVIQGGSFSKEAWKHVKSAEAALPAGQVTPSPNPNQDGGELKLMEPEHYPEAVQVIVDYAKRVAKQLIGVDIEVRVSQRIDWKYEATYGPTAHGTSGLLTLGYGTLGHSWFKRGPGELVDALLIHEFAHHAVSDHFSHAFHEECCRLGARMVTAALIDPELRATEVAVSS